MLAAVRPVPLPAEAGLVHVVLARPGPLSLLAPSDRPLCYGAFNPSS
jgi:hypothetical protein